MKKSLLILSLLTAVLGLNAASYGIMINGSDYHAGELNPSPLDPSFTEYQVLNVNVPANATLQLWDQENNAGWAVDLDGASVSGITRSGDHYTCSAAGCYDFYIKLKYGADQLYIGACQGSGGGGGEGGGGEGGGGGSDPVTPGDYNTAVPSQCTDVMLQAFYWDSNTDKGFGNTQWNTLNGQAAEIGQNFQMVWLPPSGYPNAYTSSKLGYIPQRYSYQTCNMGMVGALNNLISSLHNNGVRVIADIVINHAGNRSNACDFDEQDFGDYGKFSPTSKWITSNDEGQCDKGSNPDDGQHEANYAAARDWDHKNQQVQQMFRAYLKWLKAVMKYDGFRFDYCGGYHTSHINDYVSNSKPYFSVMEYWSGDANELKARVDDASRNTLTFDFANMYTAFRDGIASQNYGKLVNAGLRGQGYSKYACTFIDNHDTFQRGSDGVTDICGKGDGSSINNSSVMLQCNAYLLSMPGVPCVFWPHWVKYKSEIKKMIHARRMAGVHSESSVSENAGGGFYEATIQGKYGSVILYLGSSASKSAPSGYTEGAKGSGYAMYYTGNGPQAIDNLTTNDQQLTTKFIKDGQLYIERNGQTYTVTGQKVN